MVARAPAASCRPSLLGSSVARLDATPPPLAVLEGPATHENGIVAVAATPIGGTICHVSIKKRRNFQNLMSRTRRYHGPWLHRPGVWVCKSTVDGIVQAVRGIRRGSRYLRDLLMVAMLGCNRACPHWIIGIQSTQVASWIWRRPCSSGCASESG